MIDAVRCEIEEICATEEEKQYLIALLGKIISFLTLVNLSSCVAATSLLFIIKQAEEG